MLELKLAKNKMENEEGMNHLLVKVKPIKAEVVNVKPIAFVLLLDVSGSMSRGIGQKGIFNPHLNTENESKLSYVKQAADKMVDMLSDGDMLGVVSFSNTASLEHPLATLNQQTRFQLKDRIRSLQTRGATNVSEGLEAGFHQITDKIKETHQVKMILLSDGHANNGITDADGIATLANKYRQSDVSVTTIGVGDDYNSFYMESIATASGSMFYHLKEMNELNSILEKELQTLKALTTKQVTLQIKVADGMEIEENLNGYKEDAKGQVYLGNLFSEQYVLVELGTTHEIKPGMYDISVQVRYVDQHNVVNEMTQVATIEVVTEDNMVDYKSDEEVVKYVKAMMEAKVSKDAIRDYEIGNINGATANINASMLKMQSMTSHYGLNMEQSVVFLDNLERNISTGALNSEQSKAMYSESYKKTRNQSSED